ncbi:slipin family protein [Paractinoplanes rishiriensis]|uniref:Membrane protein n=1 Tax=Paractinoplanes rishiriensis TaxID=1050105 RepID=A0A919K730_9ACTN|nr:slipin family protein [Actinoplanes rishiriensis]GIF00860.1 membrane protein [Actinoplanes rishiriensis]
MSEALRWSLLAGLGLALLLVASVRVVMEYERGVVFRLGRVIATRGPGLTFLIPFVDRMVRVSLRTVTMSIPPQDVITKDNVTVKVNAVAYFNVVVPLLSVTSVENHVVATSQIAQTTLRSILGQVNLDDLLIDRDSINQRLQLVIDEITSAWGVKVTLVEVKDVELPETMRRAMARQAEAERDRRAKVIHAAGELEAADDLGRAAQVLEEHPAAMQLRVLSTMAELTAERSSTLIFPLPIELLRLADTLHHKLAHSPDSGTGEPAGAGTASDPNAAVAPESSVQDRQRQTDDARELATAVT